MTKRFKLLCFAALMSVLSVVPVDADAQIFAGEKVPYTSLALFKSFTSYEVFEIDAQSLANLVQNNTESNPVLSLGAHQWLLSLSSSQLLSENYTLRVETPQGVSVITHQPNIAFKGYEAGGGNVRLTIDKEFIMGYVEQNGLTWYIEPLYYLEPDAPRNQFLVYERSDVKHDPNVSCGVTEAMEKAAELDRDHESEAEQLGVYELELAIASDQLMLAKYGSTGAVEGHNIAVINMVEGDYTGAFNHDLCFNIVTQYVANTFPWPWSGSNDAGTLLGSFQAWGQGGGFGVNFDIGELWTDRDFNGGTVGIAYLNGVCNTVKYHCLQDFTNNDDFLRCMTSHEIGHNFSATHDNCTTGEFIMCPFVSNATAWSAQSQSQINPFMQARINNGCLGSCSQGPPLVSAFTWTPEPGCVGQPVQFTDQSTGIITAWAWTFAGGSPATSTQQNPTVVFNSPGPHQVTLLITGTSGNTNAHAETITTDPLPVSNYTYTVDDLTVTFTNTSQNATTYYWEFGDGFDSFEQDPVHTYSVAGTYLVTLTATSHCGSVTRPYTVTTAPAAQFSAEPTSGCATLQVNMVNESSSNAVTYQWSFPGGAPAASNQPEPTVYYSVPGIYSITLIAYNSSGSSTFTRTNYITVSTVPAPGFNFNSNGLTVSFNNTSVNGTSYLWEFGDGTTSTLQNPTHTYANGGTYTVKLTTTNACGSTTITKTVSLIPAPTASFTTTGSPGCAPQTVSFTNTSTDATTYSWSFPGGTPPASSDTNPVVVYDLPGTYTATLVAINGSGTDTATAVVTIGTVPGAGFNSSTSGTLATFTNTTTNGTSYSWDFGDGATSTETDPSHTYTADGVYTVVLTATNACGSSTVTQTVTIITPPAANFTAGPLTGCPGLTVVFDNTSSDNATTFAWSFPGGSPDTSSLENPVVVYNAPGQYNVTLIASNPAGADTVVFVNYIQVGSVPVASFSSATNGTVVSFTNSSTDATSYSWDFGDNSGSSETNPVHTYAADGVYTVTLSATNSCGTVTSTQTVTVTTAPSANFTAGNTSGCGPLQVTFENTSSENATSWFWTFEGGEPATSTEENPTVIYLNPGSYDVTLIATGAGGSDTLTRTDYVTVQGAPTGGFTSTQVQNTVSFTNTSADATSYTWTFGDGNVSTDANPTHTYAADGVYTVVLAATNSCGTTFVEQTVTIITVPVAAFTFNGAIGCSPFLVQFDNTSSDNATSIEWTFEGGTPATSTEENPVVTWDAPGVYNVTLVASNQAGSSTATASITVIGGPSAGFTSQTAGLSVIFSNSSQNGGTYSWDFGDGTTSQEENPTHTYAGTGTYTVVLTAYNECGTSTYTQVVTIEGSAPLVSFTSDTQKGCAGVTVQFTDQSAGDPVSWQWTFEGGNPATSSEQNPSVTYATPGTYAVTLQATNIYGSNTSTQPGYVTIIGAPLAGFNYSAVLGTITFTSTSQGADSYAWNFGDGGTSNEANPVHVYDQSGAYTVTLTVTNDCGAATLEQSINVITVGTQEVPWLNDFEVYPNPGTGRFTLEMTGEPQKELEVALYNTLGQRLRSEVVDFSSGDLTKVLDYTTLPSAAYTLRITAAGASKNVRLVIQK